MAKKKNEGLSARQLKLKERLLGIKRKMWNELREEFFGKLGREYNSQFDTPNDLEDLSILDALEDTGLAVADIKKRQLEDLDESLRKIDEGTYGVCSNCGTEIDDGRLKAEPFAEYCVACKKESEKGSKKPTL